MMFDIIFLSYDEPNAEDKWDIFLKRFPWAQRVHGIEGIYNAHKAAAVIAKTSMFWVVDADCSPIPSFDFSVQPTNKDLVHVWYSINPVNDLIYGFGGIKLFPRQRLLSTDVAGVDVATSVFGGIVVVEEIASITRFNTSPFVTWRSAFRENVKLFTNLTNGYEDDNKSRMLGWLKKNDDVEYGDYCVNGALDGQQYANENFDNKMALSLINDYNWLKERFSKRYGTI